MALTQVTPDVLHNIQSNVTQVGTLSNLSVTGNITSGNVTATNFTGTASLANNASFLGGTAAASYALGSTVTTANTNMKGYVDGQISTTSSSITTSNTAMKGYVDAVTTAWTANAGVQAGSISALETSKANLAGAAFTGNISTTGNLTVSGNVGASTLNISANITFSSTNVPHRIRGDYSTAFTSVSLKNKVFFQSSGATDDTYIRVLGGTSSGIGGIQLYGTYDPDNSTVLQLDSVPGLQSRIVSYANGTATAVPLRISAGSTDVVIGTSGVVEISGEISTTDLTVTNTIAGTATNALSLGGTAAASYAQTSTVIGVGQTWQQFTVPTQRASGTTYTNSTGKPISISVRLEQDDGNMSLTVAGLMIGRTGYTAGPVYYTLSAIIPAGSTYLVTSTGTSATQLFWYELR
jgi:hypothetical protein